MSVVPQEMWGEIIEKLEELEQHSEALDVGTDAFDDADDDALRPDRVHRRGRRVLTSAAPAVTEGNGDRCRCGRNCSAASVVKPETVWRIASRWQRETNATRLRALR